MGAIIDGQQYKGSFMSNQDGVWSDNGDGTWSESVPLPFYGIRKRCQCGKSFWKEENYRKHYIKSHTDGKHYNRTPTGLTEVEDVRDGTE